MMQINRLHAQAILLALGMLFLGSQGVAQVVGRYSGEFMAAGAGARSQGLGGAAAASSGEPWSLFFNPAGLASVDRAQLGLMHSERFAGVVDYDAVAFSMPHEANQTLTVGMLRLGVNGIPFTTLEYPDQPMGDANRIEVDKYVNDGEYAFYLAKAGRWDNAAGWINDLGLSWGVAPKLIFKHIGSYRHYGLGLDAGLMKHWEGAPLFAVGFAVRDLLGTLIKSEKTGRTEVIVSTFRLGGSVMLPLPVLEADFTILADGAYRTESIGEKEAFEYHAGAEYLVRKILALRAGSDNGELTFGGGLAFKLVSIDYAFIGHDDLGDTHRISLTARWGRF